MRPLRDIFAAEAALADLIDRRRHELALLQALRRLVPPALASQIGVADATRPELLLAIASGAAAALLRHRAPDVLEGLAREGWKFTGIRLRVQAGSSSGRISKVYAKRMDLRAIVALREGADRIADTALASALRRLADRAAEGSEGEHQPLEGVEEQHARQKK
jgi:hypothetical protein